MRFRLAAHPDGKRRRHRQIDPNRCRHAAGHRSQQSLQRNPPRQAQRHGRQTSFPRLRAQPQLQRRLGHRSGDLSKSSTNSKSAVNPQHVVPSWDLKTLWVNNNAEGTDDGSVTPIDPLTGKPGKNIPVDDPYNMYFTPDGSAAIVVAEAHKRLDFRDPHTMAMKFSIDTPQCRRHQSRRFFHRRPLRDFYLRVCRIAGENRSGRKKSRRLSEIIQRAACRRTCASPRTAKYSTLPT